MDWMVLEKISCLYNFRTKSLYPPLWMSFMHFGSVDLKNGQNRRTSNNMDDETLLDSPASNSKILISCFTVNLPLCSWLSILSLPKRKSAMRKMLGTKCSRQNRTRPTTALSIVYVDDSRLHTPYLSLRCQAMTCDN